MNGFDGHARRPGAFAMRDQITAADERRHGHSDGPGVAVTHLPATTAAAPRSPAVEATNDACS